MHGLRLKRRHLNRYCIVGISVSVTLQSQLILKVKRVKFLNSHMDRPGHGTIYSGIIYASAGYNGAEMCTFRFAENMVGCGEKSGKTAENSGIAMYRWQGGWTGPAGRGRAWKGGWADLKS